jgi:hypothetical protein
MTRQKRAEAAGEVTSEVGALNILGVYLSESDRGI